MIALKEILVATDFGPASDNALRYGGDTGPVDIRARVTEILPGIRQDLEDLVRIGTDRLEIGRAHV